MTEDTQDRRSVFREYMRRMNPKADPALAISEHLYVASPLSTSAQVATRLELEPDSTHLIIGATGSGKTTELLAIQQRLANVEDILTLFVDVPAVQQLSKLSNGVLLGLAWKMIWTEFEQRDPDAAKNFDDARYATNLADGFYTDPSEYDRDEDYYFTPGLISPPEKNEDIERLLGYTRQLLTRSSFRYVLLFDGLDRVRDVGTLTSMLLHDLFRLSGLGIGSVVVGPPELRGASYREFNERFATFHFHGAADPGREDTRRFLEHVLEIRGLNLLPAGPRAALVEWSGGILRDLIALAKNAGDSAYGSGHDAIDDVDVTDAADRFGRALLVGISEKSAARLTELSGIGRQRYFDFTAASPDDLDLLLRRLVIEVMDIPPRFFIHPTVRPLVRGLRKAV